MFQTRALGSPYGEGRGLLSYVMEMELTWDTEMVIPAEGIQEGDRVLGYRVERVIWINDWIVQLFSEDEVQDEGFTLDITKTMKIPITRTLPLADDQCVVCGGKDKKIVAKHMDGTCYQRSKRSMEVSVGSNVE